MDSELLSTSNGPISGSHITETTPDVRHRRAEKVLGLPVVKGKTWAAVVTIAPAQAKAILLAMPPQRPQSPANIRFFTAIIKEGKFKVTHQGIAFDREGKLIDGMHRLTACIEADTPITVQATFNLDRDLFDSMDRGRNRSISDDLFCGSLTTNASKAQNISTAARIIWSYERGWVPWVHVPKELFTSRDVVAIMEKYPEIYHAETFAMRNNKACKGIGRSAVTAFYTMFRTKNSLKADEFMEKVVTGENLSQGNPAYTFREYLRMYGSSHSRGRQGNSMIALVKCWNAFAEGRTMTKVPVVMKGDLKFPVISKGR